MTPAVIDSGRAVYLAHCARCHGKDLEGEPNWRTRDAQGLLPAPPHDPSGHTWHHSDQVLFALTKYGPGYYAGPDYLSRMPAFDGMLSDDAIWSVLAFIKSTWPDEIASRQAALN